MTAWGLLIGGGILVVTPMFLNPVAGVNGMTLVGIVLVVAGFWLIGRADHV